MHLIDQARVHVEETYRRPALDRFFRALVAQVLPEPKRMQQALSLARFGKPLAPLLDLVKPLRPAAAMLRLAPNRLPRTVTHPEARPLTSRRGRVAVLTGCAQSVLAPSINEASFRLLQRMGFEPVVPKGQGCCGALTHHMGREDDALSRARRNIDSYMSEIDGEGLDAIIINASGCGTTVKDYGHMFARDPLYAEQAQTVSSLTKDITEFVAEHGLPEGETPLKVRVAYHAACSMQHGQKIRTEPTRLLLKAGFEVVEPAEGHLCCGSAGTYNILQPELAGKLRDRKLAHLAQIRPDVIATGNIGCMTQLASGTDVPLVHTVELLDWATGGPRPAAMVR